MMDYSKVKGVIFDFDGTLYETRKVGFNMVLENPLHMFTMLFDRLISKELIGRDFGNRENFIVEFGKRWEEKTKKPAKDCLPWYQKVFFPVMIKVLKKKYRARPKVAEIFNFLYKNNIPFAVLSDYPYVKERLEAIGLTKEEIAEPAACYCSTDFGCYKPVARPFLQIAGEMKVAPDKILVVGDRDDTDGEGARRSGMQFVQIKTKKTVVIELTHKVYDWLEFYEVLTGSQPS